MGVDQYNYVHFVVSVSTTNQIEWNSRPCVLRLISPNLQVMLSHAMY